VFIISLIITPKASLSDNVKILSLENAVVYQISNPVTPKKIVNYGLGNGYCVDLIKYYRDIPWNGDAKWYYNKAVEYGFSVGNIPKVNAIWVKITGIHGHVALVIEVSEESFIVTEQNVLGRGIVSNRTIIRKDNQLFVY